MPLYEIESNGKTYEVEAPDQRAAFQALAGNGQPKHYAFDGSKIPGYNLETGMVEKTGMRDKVRAFGGGVANGIPIAGPYIHEGQKRARDWLYGEGGGDDLTRAMQDNPKTTFAGEMTGAVGAGAAGAMAMPQVAGGMLMRSGLAALGGSAIGGADTAVRSGGDLRQTAAGGLLGGVLGGAAVPLGSLVGSGLSKVAERAGPWYNQAQKAFARAAGADGIDFERALTELGPDGMAMDLGPNLRGQASGMAATPGEGQAIIRGAIRDRDAGANSRIRGAVDRTLGPAQMPSAIEAQIRTGQDALGPEYERLFLRARAVNTEPLANNLDAMVVRLRGPAQAAARKVRGMLEIEGAPGNLDPNPQTLHEARMAIDGLMATESDTNAIRAYTIARQQLDRILAASVPGIKELDGQFAELGRQGTALGRGQQTLDSGRTAPRPEELANEFRAGALPQGAQIGPSAVPVRLRQGARAEIERIIGTNANDRVALQRLVKGEGDWNRDRLGTLFGQARADRIIRVLDAERTFAETSTEVTKNSVTEGRRAAREDLGLGAKERGSLRSAFNWQFGDAAANIGDRIAAGAQSERQQAMNAQLSRMLTSRDPQELTRAVRIVQAAQSRGDITAERAKEIVQGLAIAANQQTAGKGRVPMVLGQKKRQPLEITVSPGRP